MNKHENQLDEMWQEHITSRDTPTESESEKELLDHLYCEITEYDLATNLNTNYKAYRKIAELYNQKKSLIYNTVAKTFSLENRSELDLQNLKEFIICVTLLGGNDVLKAQVRKDKQAEKIQIERQKTRCDLMSALLLAIDSYLCTQD